MSSTESEAPVRKLTGLPSRLASVLAIGLSLYSLLWVLTIIEPQVYRTSFLLGALVLTFLLYPFTRKHQTLHAIDWAMIALTVVALAWPLLDFRQFHGAADEVVCLPIREPAPQRAKITLLNIKAQTVQRGQDAATGLGDR